MCNKTLISFVISMKKNITIYLNSSVILSLVLILSGTGILDLVSPCYAQAPCWTQKADMPTGRWDLSTCVVDGKIYAIGGMGPVYQALSTVEQYDPATDTWTKKSDMPTARDGFSSSLVDGKIYAIGGCVFHNSSFDETILSMVEEYDPVTDTWTTKPDMPVARAFHSASVVDDRIYIIGGSSSYPFSAILTLEVYEPATDTWTQKGDIPRAIYTGCFTGVVDGKIYVMGGDGRGRRVDEYDPATDTWIRKTDMPIYTTDQSTSVLEGKIYVIGGEAGPPPTYPGMTIVEVYDPSTDTWETASDMPTGRFGLRASAVDGKIYAIGGIGYWITTVSRKVEEYDPSKDLTGVERIDSRLPKQFALNQNYPNPFNPTTMINYQLPKTSKVELCIYNLLGQKMVTLVSEKQPAGIYTIEWHAKDQPSGIYLVHLQAGNYIETRKLVLQK